MVRTQAVEMMEVMASPRSVTCQDMESWTTREVTPADTVKRRWVMNPVEKLRKMV